MFIKFTREGIWWMVNKLDAGKLEQYSFVWPMVFQWLKNTVKGDKPK